MGQHIYKKTELGTIGASSYEKPNVGMELMILTKDENKKSIEHYIAFLDAVDGKFKLSLKKEELEKFGIEVEYE